MAERRLDLSQCTEPTDMLYRSVSVRLVGVSRVGVSWLSGYAGIQAGVWNVILTEVICVSNVADWSVSTQVSLATVVFMHCSTVCGLCTLCVCVHCVCGLTLKVSRVNLLTGSNCEPNFISVDTLIENRWERYITVPGVHCNSMQLLSNIFATIATHTADTGW